MTRRSAAITATVAGLLLISAYGLLAPGQLGAGRGHTAAGATSAEVAAVDRAVSAATWRPPFDGNQALALPQQSDDDPNAEPTDGSGDDASFILVVSTRSGQNPDVAVGLTQRSSLPWLAAGVAAVAAGLMATGLTVVGAAARAPVGASTGSDGSERPTGRRRFAPTGQVLSVGLILLASVGVFVLVAAIIGGLDA